MYDKVRNAAQTNKFCTFFLWKSNDFAKMEKQTIWQGEILARLEQRDSLEKKDSIYFKAFNQIAEELLIKGGRVETADSSDLELRRLSKQNHGLEIENNQLVDRLNGGAVEIEKSKIQINSILEEKTRLEKQIGHLKNKLGNSELEVSEKNKSILLINDELLLSSILNNVLIEKSKILAEENDKLVTRWMQKMELDANKVNETNESLTSSNTGK